MRKVTSINPSLIFLLFVFAFTACSSNQKTNSEISSTNLRLENRHFPNKPVNFNDELERQKFEEISREIEKNRNLWKEKNISNYDFEVEHFIEGIDGHWKLTFKVRDDQILLAENKKYHVPYYEYKRVNSVDKLFDYIWQSLEEGREVHVKFDKEYGFPKSITNSDRKSTGYETFLIERLEIVK